MRPTGIQCFTGRSFPSAINASGKKWVIVTDLAGEPAFVLDSHHFLRDALFNQSDTI